MTWDEWGGFSLMHALRTQNCTSQRNFEEIVGETFPEVSDVNAKYGAYFNGVYVRAKDAVAKDLARDGVEFDVNVFVALTPAESFSVISQYPTSKNVLFVIPSSTVDSQTRAARVYSEELMPRHEMAHVGQKALGSYVDDHVINNVIADTFAGFDFLNYNLPLSNQQHVERRTIDFCKDVSIGSDDEIAGTFLSTLTPLHEKVYSKREFERHLNALDKLKPVFLEQRNSGRSYLSIGNSLSVHERYVEYLPTHEKYEI